MVPPGIAGSRAAATAGVFLCSDIDGAEWFADMCRDGTADIWSVTVHESGGRVLPRAAEPATG